MPERYRVVHRTLGASLNRWPRAARPRRARRAGTWRSPSTWTPSVRSARNCQILLLEANSASTSALGAAVNTAVADGANAVSNSYGSSEFSGETGSSSSSYYEHPGVAIVASTGDTAGEVEFPSVVPDVIAAGGTSLLQSSNQGTRSASATETVWDGTPSAGDGSGAGCSAYESAATLAELISLRCGRHEHLLEASHGRRLRGRRPRHGAVDLRHLLRGRMADRRRDEPCIADASRPSTVSRVTRPARRPTRARPCTRTLLRSTTSPWAKSARAATTSATRRSRSTATTARPALARRAAPDPSRPSSSIRPRRPSYPRLPGAPTVVTRNPDHGWSLVGRSQRRHVVRRL